MSFPNLFRSTAFAPAMEAHPLICFDIGSRGGFERDLEPLAFAVEAHGFEPDPEAFAAIQGEKGLWKSLTHHPLGVSGEGGPQTLYIPEDPQGASLMEHDPAIGRRFDKPHFFTIEAEQQVETQTLDRAVALTGVERVDYLKLDIEGPELQVLQSGPLVVAGLVAAKVEVSFVPSRKGQALAREIEEAMSRWGFQLMDFIRVSHWRRQGHIIHPHIGEPPVPYSKGQLIQGDYLFFRDPETIRDRDQALRAAWIAMGHGYFDHAASLLERENVAEYLKTAFGVDGKKTLGIASRAMGRAVWAEAFKAHLKGIRPFLGSLKRLWFGR